MSESKKLREARKHISRFAVEAGGLFFAGDQLNEQGILSGGRWIS